MEKKNNRLISHYKAGDKIINDPIHGFITLDQDIVSLVDTDPVQRLRQLSQLGMTYYIYPGATHKRFEHSLGVSNLSKQYALCLMDKDANCDSMNYKEKLYYSKILEIAGLCHDLGHGPFSHAFEKIILPSIGVDKWHHEEMSTRLVEYIFENYDINDDEINKNEIDLVKRLIDGGPVMSWEPTEIPIYLFDIVNNTKNSFDVDKIDYLQRDSYYTNIKVSASYDRFLHYMHVIENKIHYRLKERNQIIQVFKDRANMFEIVYQHKVTVGIELMIADAIREVNEYLKIKESIRDIELFLKLDDSIYNMISNEWIEKDTINGKKAIEICNRIKRRDIYAFCGEVNIPSAMIGKLDNLEMIKVDITTRQSTDGQVDLRTEDIHLAKLKKESVNEKETTENSCFYYDPFRDHYLLSIDDLKSNNKDLLLRIYCKDKQHRKYVINAFDKWISDCVNTNEYVSTPDKNYNLTAIQSDDNSDSIIQWD